MNLHSFGKLLKNGWHIRLEFVRQWGKYSGFRIPENVDDENVEGVVVAVTLAKMKLPQIPRFLKWGRPVEKLVRDSPGTILSLASIKLPNLVSTFSIWENQEDMVAMVRGHSSVPKPKRHIDAMAERNRKDFHFEFTTLRFKPLKEFGSWKGRNSFIIAEIKNH